MKENRMDRITDRIKVRINRIADRSHKQFKGTNPYRQELIKKQEALTQYAQYTTEDLDFMADQFSPEATQEYVDKMEEARRQENA